MSELVVEQVVLPDPDQLYNQGKSEIQDVRTLKVGEGSTIFYTDKEGSRWGSIIFDDAGAYIKPDGSFRFKNNNGDVIIDSLGGGTGDYIQIINSAIDSASKTILSDWTFEATDYAGAFKTGNITWSTTTGLVTGGTGIVINDRGIIGAASGVATFTIDSTTGNATFAGTLAAASGTLGSITIGTNAWHVDSSGNMWWGNFASYAAATIKISNAGVVAFSGGTFTGTVKALGTSTTSDVWISGSTGAVEFYYNNSQIASITASTSSQLFIHSDNDIGIDADDDMVFSSGSDFLVTADASIGFWYNYNGGSDTFNIINEGTLVAQFTDGNDLNMQGNDVITSGFFIGNHKSSGGSTGQTFDDDIVTSVYLDGDILKYKYRNFAWEDGLLVDHDSSESTGTVGDVI